MFVRPYTCARAVLEPSGRAVQTKIEVCRPAQVLYIPSWVIWTNWDPLCKRYMAPLTVTHPHESDSVDLDLADTKVRRFTVRLR